jgi:hypothetical protein
MHSTYAFATLFNQLAGKRRRFSPEDIDPPPAGPGVVVVARQLPAVHGGVPEWAPVDVLDAPNDMLTVARNSIAQRAHSDDEFFAWLIPIDSAGKRRAIAAALTSAMSPSK